MPDTRQQYAARLAREAEQLIPTQPLRAAALLDDAAELLRLAHAPVTRPRRRAEERVEG